MLKTAAIKRKSVDNLFNSVSVHRAAGNKLNRGPPKPISLMEISYDRVTPFGVAVL